MCCTSPMEPFDASAHLIYQRTHYGLDEMSKAAQDEGKPAASWAPNRGSHLQLSPTSATRHISFPVQARFSTLALTFISAPEASGEPRTLVSVRHFAVR